MAESPDTQRRMEEELRNVHARLNEMRAAVKAMSAAADRLIHAAADRGEGGAGFED